MRGRLACELPNPPGPLLMSDSHYSDRARTPVDTKNLKYKAILNTHFPPENRTLQVEEKYEDLVLLEYLLFQDLVTNAMNLAINRGFGIDPLFPVASTDPERHRRCAVGEAAASTCTPLCRQAATGRR
jgi:hypothetical protein